MTGNHLTDAQVWQVLLCLVLPLLVCYAGLVVWGCKRDRRKR